MTIPQEYTPPLLELMVKARISAFLMELEIILDRFDSEEFDRHRDDAWAYAEQAGYFYPDRPIPPMFDGVYELSDAWRSGQSRYQERISPQKARVWLNEEDGFLPGWYEVC